MANLERNVNAAQIYYVFSFAFTPIPLRDQIRIDNSDKYLGEHLSEDLRDSRIKPYYFKPRRTDWHKSEEAEMPNSRATLYAPFHHLSISTARREVILNDSIDATTNSHIALFESGMGVIWLKFEINGKIDLETLKKISGRHNLPVFKILRPDTQEETHNITLHDAFLSQISGLLNSLNRSLLPIESESLKKLLSESSISSLFKEESEDQFQVFWIDIDENTHLLWQDHSNEFSRKNAFQEPCTALLLKVDSSFRDALDDSNQDIKNSAKVCISEALHSMDSMNIDSTHIAEHSSKQLVNLFPDKRFRTFIHGNMLLLLHSEEFDSEDYRNFTYGLFRTFCAVRGCWHIYFISNEFLDFTIDGLLRDINNANKEYDLLLNKQKEIIKQKGYFLRSIATQDPLIWGVGLTPFGMIFDESHKIFKITELKENVVLKIRELDRLFDVIHSIRLNIDIPDASETSPNLVAVLLGIIFLLSPTILNNPISKYIESSFVHVFIILSLCFIGVLLVLYGKFK